ncbi:MAG: HNH endonuclease [Gammaproteobacteria bacterium]|nr:HNH endonuclease [Gammaproteobacteria bacterium]
MNLLDNQDHLLDAELSLDVLDGAHCIVIESSGGANRARGVKRRNPDYNKLLGLLFERLAAAGISVTNVVLDSTTVSELPIQERSAKLAVPYPINLKTVEIDEFRKALQREVAGMHRAPGTKSTGNAQKRIRICLDKPATPDSLIYRRSAPHTEAEPPTITNGLSETERAYIRASRLGQGQFRKDVINAYNGVCAVTGIQSAQLLIASHIKPWNVATNTERLDPQNGILLSALADKLFDKGLISFTDDGQTLISPNLSISDRLRCGLGQWTTIDLAERSRRYMEYHRFAVFKNV